jgi:hypothetical protein
MHDRKKTFTLQRQFFESQLIFNSQSRNVCQLSYLHQISAVENEEWKILESRTQKGGIFERTLEKEEVTGSWLDRQRKQELKREGKLVKLLLLCHISR